MPTNALATAKGMETLLEAGLSPPCARRRLATIVNSAGQRALGHQPVHGKIRCQRHLMDLRSDQDEWRAPSKSSATSHPLGLRRQPCVRAHSRVQVGARACIRSKPDSGKVSVAMSWRYSSRFRRWILFRMRPSGPTRLESQTAMEPAQPQHPESAIQSLPGRGGVSR